MLKRVIVDIETIGKDFESLDRMSKEYLLKSAKTDEEIEETKDKLALSPLTGEIVAIGMLDSETNQGIVYFQAPNMKTMSTNSASELALFTNTYTKGEQHALFEKDRIRFEIGTEKEILGKFWDKVKTYDQIITFNGRAFDAPFLMVRSAILRIKPTKDLMPNRYSSSSSHIDLLDQFTFFGAMRKKFNLHMWCRAFGIPSPKEKGITGEGIKELFREGRYTEIAKYCLADLYATKELFDYWDKFVRL